MARRKKRKETEVEESDRQLRNILRAAKLPLLTLDERYHALLPEEMKTPKIRALEKRLNDLVKNEGKLNSDIKEMSFLKKRLLHQVLENTKDGDDELKDRKQEKLRDLVTDINQKTTEAKIALDGRPEEIRRANEDLLVECLKIWYGTFRVNKKQIDEIGDWIRRVQKELKKQLLIKQERERENHEIYSYMHALMGPHVMEQLDASMDAEDGEQ